MKKFDQTCVSTFTASSPPQSSPSPSSLLLLFSFFFFFFFSFSFFPTATDFALLCDAYSTQSEHKSEYVQLCNANSTSTVFLELSSLLVTFAKSQRYINFVINNSQFLGASLLKHPKHLKYKIKIRPSLCFSRFVSLFCSLLTLIPSLTTHLLISHTLTRSLTLPYCDCIHLKSLCRDTPVNIMHTLV